MREDKSLHYTSFFQSIRSESCNVIDHPLSENNILVLQDIFLTNGFQKITVKNIEVGRSLIYTFLDSLAVYHDVASLTTVENIPLRNGVAHIYHELSDGEFLDFIEESYLEEFFMEQFYYDFVWIEATDEIAASVCFTKIKNKIKDLKIDVHIPIIELEYAVF